MYIHIKRRPIARRAENKSGELRTAIWLYGRDRYEFAPAILVCQTVSLIPPALLRGEFAQFLIDERQELLSGVRVALLDEREDAGDFIHLRRDLENLEVSAVYSLCFALATRGSRCCFASSRSNCSDYGFPAAKAPVSRGPLRPLGSAVTSTVLLITCLISSAVAWFSGPSHSIIAEFGPQRTLSDPLEASYLGVHLWAQAVQAAGREDVAAIRRALCGQRFHAPEGEVRVDPDTQHLWKTARVARITSKGTAQIVWMSAEPVRPVPFPATRSRQQWEGLVTDLRTRWGGQWAGGERRYHQEPSHEATPEWLYERSWALTLLEQGLTRLREELAGAGKERLFESLKGTLTVEAAPRPYAASSWSRGGRSWRRSRG
jgi:hypothetical protein